MRSSWNKRSTRAVIRASLQIALLVAAGAASACTAAEPSYYEVVVYGGTAGGAIAALAAAQEGASVALLEPHRHIGGMVSGGLGATDFGNKIVIGGMSREFFVRVGRHYGQPLSWYFEPHIAEQVLNSWLKEKGVQVLVGHRLDRVSLKDGRIHTLRTENGATFAAKVFMDCSYKGDLMAQAKVSYTWGREGMDQYGETLAGVRERCEFHQFSVSIPGRDQNGKLLPLVYPGERGSTGQADHKVQAYNFRICLCNRRENQVPFNKPEGYDPARYEILRRYLAIKGNDLRLGQILSIIMMPNGKTDINNNGPISTDYIGESWEYPEADYAKRQRIWNDHLRYVQGYFYFLANDPSVPGHIQDEMNKWGLAKDEFVDTGHWPHQLYIREARRMIGEYVMIQKDLQTDREKPDSIGMGSYNSDSHHVQRIVRPDGMLENEGDMQVRVKPYEIAFSTVLPRRAECPNLLVPVCFSASHVAYSSMRMEPQYMIIGQAAGLAASAAAKSGKPVQDTDVAWLQQRLREGKSVLKMSEAIK